MVGTLACLPFAPTLADELGRADGSSVAWMVYLGTAGRMGALAGGVLCLAARGWRAGAERPPRSRMPLWRSFP
jgi:hypothetical protein